MTDNAAQPLNEVEATEWLRRIDSGNGIYFSHKDVRRALAAIRKLQAENAKLREALETAMDVAATALKETTDGS